MIPGHLIVRAVIMCSALLTACQTTAAQQPISATLADMDSKTMNKLSEVLSKAMDGRHVKLDAEKLIGQKTISVPPAKLALEGGQPIDGRSMAMPTHFDVMMSGRKCYLQRRDTGETYKLGGIACSPADKA